MEEFSFAQCADWLLNQANRFRDAGCVVEFQRDDLPSQTVRVRLEDKKHLGEVVVWRDRGQMSAFVADLTNGQYVFEMNTELQDGGYSEINEFLNYFTK